MRKKTLFYFLATFAALLNVISISLDTIVESVYVPDPWLYGLLNFYIGSFTGFFIVLFLSLRYKNKIIGQFLDPNFKGFRFLTRDEITLHILAGIGNAISSAGYFVIVTSTKDPSTILPYTQLVIIYLVIGDTIIEKDTPSILEIQSLLMVSLGALLASISPYGEIYIREFIIVLFVINTGKMLLILSQRKLRVLRVQNRRVDSITIRIWNLLITTGFFSLIVIFINPAYLLASINYLIGYIFWLIFAIMTIVFVAQIAYIRALGIGKSSITQAVNSVSILFGLIASAILSTIMPNIFAPIALNPQIFLIKIIGIIFVAFGIFSLATGEVKAYVFVRVKPGPQKHIMDQLWKIRGVKTVSAVAGAYDFILMVRLRALGKAYSRIIRKIEKIKEIEDFEWYSILKEYEEI